MFFGAGGNLERFLENFAFSEQDRPSLCMACTVPLLPFLGPADPEGSGWTSHADFESAGRNQGKCRTLDRQQKQPNCHQQWARHPGLLPLGRATISFSFASPPIAASCLTVSEPHKLRKNLIKCKTTGPSP